MKKHELKSKTRRDFFRAAGLGAGAVGAAAVGLGSADAEATPKSTGKKRAGYRETAHVKKYYELARS